MELYEVYVNERIYQIIEEKDIIDLLKIDDEFLIQYICNKIKQGTGPPVHPADINGYLNIRRTSQEHAELTNEDGLGYNCTGYQDHEMSEDVSQDSTGCQEHSTSQDVSQFRRGGDETEQMVEVVNVWSHKGKTLEADQKAIELMLELRSSEAFVNRFNDKKTCKLKLWKEISDELCKNGYLGDAEKCRQKFANLTKKYIEYVRQCKQTGNEKKKIPIHYDLLHRILGEKDKVQLRDITDTIPGIRTSTGSVDTGAIDATVSETPTSCEKPTTSSVEKKRKEVLTKSDIMKKIMECNEKNIAIQQETTNKLCAAIQEQTNLMQKQVEQKEKLLKIFENMSKSRKRQDSSDSD